MLSSAVLYGFFPGDILSYNIQIASRPRAPQENNAPCPPVDQSPKSLIHVVKDGDDHVDQAITSTKPISSFYLHIPHGGSLSWHSP